MERINHFSSIVEKLTKVVSIISFASVFMIMILNVTDVLLTKLFKLPIIGTYEMTECLLMCAVFTGFAYAQSQKAHINMTIIIAKFPRAIRFLVFTIMSLFAVIIAAVMTYAAAVQMSEAISAGYMTDVLHFPTWTCYLIELIAMATFTLTLIYDTVLSAIAIFRQDYAGMVQADWS